MTLVTPHPGHAMTVTPGPVGRAYFECECGEEQTRASKADAVRVALRHHHEAGGCNCPDDVKALDVHGTTRTMDAVLASRYTLTEKGWAAVGGRSA